MEQDFISVIALELRPFRDERVLHLVVLFHRDFQLLQGVFHHGFQFAGLLGDPFQFGFFKGPVDFLGRRIAPIGTLVQYLRRGIVFEIFCDQGAILYLVRLRRPGVLEQLSHSIFPFQRPLGRQPGFMPCILSGQLAQGLDAFQWVLEQGFILHFDAIIFQHGLYPVRDFFR